MKKKRYVIGGAAAVAVLAAGVFATASAMSTNAAIPPQADSVVAAGVNSTVATLEAEAAAEAAAAEAAAAEAAAAEAAAAEAAAAEAAAQEGASTAAAPTASQPAEAAQPSSGGSPTNDYGIADSAYTGAYYDPAYEQTRKCIVNKESGGNYGIVSSNGMYHGAYQFMQSTSDAAAQKMGRPDLVGVPASQWTRAEQDEAFWVTWNHGAGAGNWPTAAGC